MRSWGRRSTSTCLVSTGDFPPEPPRVSRIIMSPPGPDPIKDWPGPGCVSVSVNCVNPILSTTVNTLSAALFPLLSNLQHTMFLKLFKLNAIQRK